MRLGSGVAAASVLVFALSGCLAVPKVGEPAQRMQVSQLESDRSLAAAPAPWPTEKWWERYGDPQLTSLIEQGIAGSPTVSQAEARLREADALADRARANTGPQLTANASVQLMKQSYNNGIPAAFVPHGYNDYGQATLNFIYDFDFWGRNRAAVAAATSEARASSADVAASRMVLAASIADAYGELSRLFAARDIAAEALKVREQSAELVRQRVTNGLETLQSERQAGAEVPAARHAVTALDEQIGLTRNRIAALVGTGPDRGLDIQRPPRPLSAPFGLPQNLAAELLGRRPDIAAARWRAEAATSRVGVARAAFYPNVNLTAFIGFQALGLANLLRPGSNVGSAGPAISLPIFDAGRIRADYRGARAEADAAVDAYNEALVEALHQVADAATSERTLATRIKDAGQSLAQSEDAYRLAKLRYQGQLSNYLTVLDAEDRVLTARRSLSDLEARAFTLDVALVRALGGGFSPNTRSDGTHQ